MENKIPFTSYDFWAYLSSGFLLLFVMDIVAGTEIFEREQWTVVQGIIAIAAAYAVGQLVASLSSLLLERGLVDRVLGPPRIVLFGHGLAPRWLRSLLPGYFKALPEEIVQHAKARAKEANVDGPGQAMFLLAFQSARASPALMARLENFLNLYGFCRNVALVSVLDAAILYADFRWFGGPTRHYWWSLCALVLGIGMTLRYLKFYRHYAYELFTAYGCTTGPPGQLKAGAESQGR